MFILFYLLVLVVSNIISVPVITYVKFMKHFRKINNEKYFWDEESFGAYIRSLDIIEDDVDIIVMGKGYKKSTSAYARHGSIFVFYETMKSYSLKTIRAVIEHESVHVEQLRFSKLDMNFVDEDEYGQIDPNESVIRWGDECKSITEWYKVDIYPEESFRNCKSFKDLFTVANNRIMSNWTYYMLPWEFEANKNSYKHAIKETIIYTCQVYNCGILSYFKIR